MYHITTYYIDDVSVIDCGWAGITELASPNFTISPNPSNGVFNLKMDGFETLKMKNLEICNVLGERVYFSDNFQIDTSSTFEIDLTTQPKGIYFICLTTEKGITTQKLVIR